MATDVPTARDTAVTDVAAPDIAADLGVSDVPVVDDVSVPDVGPDVLAADVPAADTTTGSDEHLSLGGWGWADGNDHTWVAADSLPPGSCLTAAACQTYCDDNSSDWTTGQTAQFWSCVSARSMCFASLADCMSGA